MPNAALATFAAVLSSFRGAFTAPTFFRFVVLAVGWLLVADPDGGGCVTGALVAARVAGKRHWAAFHRFFSRAAWNPDVLGRKLFELLDALLAALVVVAIDDTVCRKRGPYVFGASMHIDAVTSTRKRRNLVRGHCWVVLVVVVRVPWSNRQWAIPVLSRLYIGKKEAGSAYRTKSVLAREMLDLFRTWLDPERRLRILLDSGYMNRTVLTGLPFDRVEVIGSLKTNAAFFRPVGPSRRTRKGGRPRKKGRRLPTPAAMHNARRTPWTTVTLPHGTKTRTKQVLSLQVQWYGVLGQHVCHVVLVREDSEKLRVVLCTTADKPVTDLLEDGAQRWPIEVWNRDAKQIFGFADSPAHSRKAVLRTAPWVALLSGIVVVWFHRIYTRDLRLPLPQRPWYTTKQNLSFNDLVRAVQETFRGVDVLRWAGDVAAGCARVFRGQVFAQAGRVHGEVDETSRAA
jgi:hypothetical protein